MSTTVIAPKKDEGTLSKRNGFELIEVSPAVFKLAEQLRDMSKGSSTLEFYRSVLRNGLLAKARNLLLIADKAFLKSRHHLTTGSDSYNQRARAYDTQLQELEALKSAVEAL